MGGGEGRVEETVATTMRRRAFALQTVAKCAHPCALPTAHPHPKPQQQQQQATTTTATTMTSTTVTTTRTTKRT